MKRENLRKARLNLNLTQNELANIIGVSVDHVRSLEYGRVDPSSPLMFKISKAMNERPEVLFPDMAMM